MGLGSSTEIPKEAPYSRSDATLYYFGGRGLADQIRWMLAYTDVSFAQRVVGTRERFVNLRDSGQLAFGQLPLLQIDGLELVQSQAIVRYLARRANITGKDAQEELQCDMIAEAILDLIRLAAAAPFQRRKGDEASLAHITTMKTKWESAATRLEMILERKKKLIPKAAAAAAAASASDDSSDGNSGKQRRPTCLVGSEITYADVLLAHCLTWFVEECGADICADMPLLLEVQHSVMSKASLQGFLGGKQFYPVGDNAYCEQVSTVLARAIGT
jgi:glutathione S-transferase